MPPPDPTLSVNPAPTYGALLRVPGFGRLVTSLLLGRIGGQMLSVGLVLFVLARYHSPQLAGAAAFLITFPGLLLSPIAGALLDRYGRASLVTVDYFVAGVALFAMAGLSAGRALPPPLLLGICGVASLTGPLSAAGARSLFPTLVPSHLWERANALDSTSHVFASVIGAPAAGILVGFASAEWAVAATATVFAFAGIAMLAVREPRSGRPSGPVLSEAWSGLVYVLRNSTLRGLALTFFVFSIGWGCLVIAMPVLVLGRLHQGPAAVGYIWGAVGAAGVISTLLIGRIRTGGRERQLMAGSILAIAVAMAVLPIATSVVIVAAALVAVALVEAPFDIAFLTLRQRRSDPARFGRVFAVSMSLNVMGSPIGAALAGPLIGSSLNLALWFAVGAVVISAAFPLLTIPAEEASAT